MITKSQHRHIFKEYHKTKTLWWYWYILCYELTLLRLIEFVIHFVLCSTHFVIHFVLWVDTFVICCELTLLWSILLLIKDWVKLFTLLNDDERYARPCMIQIQYLSSRLGLIVACDLQLPDVILLPKHFHYHAIQHNVGHRIGYFHFMSSYRHWPSV